MQREEISVGRIFILNVQIYYKIIFNISAFFREGGIFLKNLRTAFCLATLLIKAACTQEALPRGGS